MRPLIFIPLLFLLSQVRSKEVTCKIVKQWLTDVQLCELPRTIDINSSDVTISNEKDGKVDLIDYSENKKVKYLVAMVNLKFPNLRYYFADDCAIQEIFQKNFQLLSKLKFLYLNGNQIKRIKSDTFEDLTSLKELGLGRNKIKVMHGQLFASLGSLTFVDLRNNECINEAYRFSEQIQFMPRNVTSKCMEVRKKPPVKKNNNKRKNQG